MSSFISVLTPEGGLKKLKENALLKKHLKFTFSGEVRVSFQVNNGQKQKFIYTQLPAPERATEQQNHAGAPRRVRGALFGMMLH